MEILEFDGAHAVADLLAHIVTSEGRRLEGGAGVLLSGQTAAPVAVAVAFAIGGAVLGDLADARYDRIATAGQVPLPIVLTTDLKPAGALAVIHAGGLRLNGWPSGDLGVHHLLDLAPRYVRLEYDRLQQCYRTTVGSLADWMPPPPGDL